MDAALDAYHAMRELVLRHPGGRADEGSLGTLRRLCRIAERAAADEHCCARLAAVEAHAAVLFAGSGSGNWVRRRILAELEEFRSRLYEVEVANSSG